MNAAAVARHYGLLTPEERFRLLLAAGARGDDAEQDRLVSAARRITFAAPDHSPYGHAFEEVLLLIFIELLEEAARYLDALASADDALDTLADEAGAEQDDDEPDAEADRGPAAGAGGGRRVQDRYLELADAAGYVLRTKVRAWERFCERLNAAPFLVWEGMPGFDRLQRALRLAERSAFDAAAMVRWLNAVRPEGEPEVTDLALTVERLADATERLFRERVEWWGG
jgi:hypothetical protein